MATRLVERVVVYRGQGVLGAGEGAVRLLLQFADVFDTDVLER